MRSAEVRSSLANELRVKISGADPSLTLSDLMCRAGETTRHEISERWERVAAAIGVLDTHDGRFTATKKDALRG